MPCKSGMTLVELILAVLLLNVVILTGVAMELGIRRTFSSTDVEVQLMDEAAPIMTMITKDISRGIGNNVLPAYDTSNIGGDSAFRIRMDTDQDGIAEASDGWVAYRFRDPGSSEKHQIWYYPDYDNPGSPHEILTKRAFDFAVSAPVNAASDIVIRLRRDPAAAAGYTNPEANVNSTAYFRSASFS